MSDLTPRLNLIQRAMQAAQVGQVGQEKIAAHDHDIGREREISQADLAQRPPKATDQFSSEIQLNYPKLHEAKIVTPVDRRSHTYNEFRSIKRKFLPMARDKTGKLSKNIVMITSAVPGEGKTFTAMNLAIGLAAENDLEVILVDADVVRSTLKRYFVGDTGAGLLNLLKDGTARIDDFMHNCRDLPNLHVIFSGKHDDAAPELLASGRMADVCSTLSKRFPRSVVIFDAPPVLATSEPAALGAHMHHILMVVAASRATRHQVEDALSAVSACPSINLLFNKAPNWQRSTPEYYYEGYNVGSDGKTIT